MKINYSNTVLIIAHSIQLWYKINDIEWIGFEFQRVIEKIKLLVKVMFMEKDKIWKIRKINTVQDLKYFSGLNEIFACKFVYHL